MIIRRQIYLKSENDSSSKVLKKVKKRKRNLKSRNEMRIGRKFVAKHGQFISVAKKNIASY